MKSMPARRTAWDLVAPVVPWRRRAAISCDSGARQISAVRGQPFGGPGAGGDEAGTLAGRPSPAFRKATHNGKKLLPPTAGNAITQNRRFVRLLNRAS